MNPSPNSEGWPVQSPRAPVEEAMKEKELDSYLSSIVVDPENRTTG